MTRKGSKVLNTASRIVTSQVGSLMLVILSFGVEIETSSFASTRMKIEKATRGLRFFQVESDNEKSATIPPTTLGSVLEVD